MVRSRGPHFVSNPENRYGSSWPTNWRPIPIRCPNHNIPHHSNTTNLHTHGLHISPSNSSDNVLLKIEPGGRFQYRFDIPDDHQPGTFWYHAYVHGSTALQVANGMGGALIIEGGLDTLQAISAARERLFMFQQMEVLVRRPISWSGDTCWS